VVKNLGLDTVRWVVLSRTFCYVNDEQRTNAVDAYFIESTSRVKMRKRSCLANGVCV